MRNPAVRRAGPKGPRSLAGLGAAAGDGAAGAAAAAAPGGSAAPPALPSAWLPGDAMEEDEQLQYDPSAYDCLHTFTTEWPCLSFDMLRDELGEPRSEWPHTLFMVAGTQADMARNNSLLVMRVSRITGKTRVRALPVGASRGRGCQGSSPFLPCAACCRPSPLTAPLPSRRRRLSPSAGQRPQGRRGRRRRRRGQQQQQQRRERGWRRGGRRRRRKRGRRPPPQRAFPGAPRGREPHPELSPEAPGRGHVGGQRPRAGVGREPAAARTRGGGCGRGSGGRGGKAVPGSTPVPARQAPLHVFGGHKDEGYAVDWSPTLAGRLSTGDCKGGLHVWEVSEGQLL